MHFLDLQNKPYFGGHLGGHLEFLEKLSERSERQKNRIYDYALKTYGRKLNIHATILLIKKVLNYDKSKQPIILLFVLCTFLVKDNSIIYCFKRPPTHTHIYT